MKKIFLFGLCVLVYQLASAREIAAEISGLNLVREKSESIDLRNPKFKASLVVFLSCHCPCSNCHNQELAKLQAKYPEVQFVAIHSNADEDLTNSKSYFQKANLPFPVIQDQNNKYADLFRAVKTPHAFLLDLKGNVLFAGGVSSSKDIATAEHFYLREAITEMLAGQEIKVKEARTLGCAISRATDENIWK